MSAAVVFAVAIVYYASNPQFLFAEIFIHGDPPLHERLHVEDDTPYAWLSESNYSFRFAEALLHGKLGLSEKPPSWLNEMIPLHGKYYAVFPLGSILTMVPFAFLRQLFVFPTAGLVIALIGAAAAFLFLRLSLGYGVAFARSIVFSLFAALGTWLWTNTVMGGAWQFTLGFALIGELGAIYYTIIVRRPLVAGLFFALAFGNRTEVILTAPIFFYFLWRDPDLAGRPRLAAFAKFCSAPLLLGLATLFHNFARFGSPTEFGLARIPGVLTEPWYQHGIFSLRAVPANAWQMLIEPWQHIDHPPYFLPDGFGGSIFLNAPFLFCMFAKGARQRDIKFAAWIAVALLTLVFWCHGNTGGWQFSYRGAILMLPWFFLLILESNRGPTPKWQIALLVVSIAINAYATYLFLWTNWIQP